MTLIDFEWNELFDRCPEYTAFAPDIWWSDANGCWCTAVQDMTKSFEDGEIIDVYIIMKNDVRFMWE